MSDLCWVCQQGNERLLRQGENEEKHRQHIEEAVKGSRCYKAQVESAKEFAKNCTDAFKKTNRVRLKEWPTIFGIKPSKPIIHLTLCSLVQYF